MTINRLTDERVLIILQEDEISDYSGDIAAIAALSRSACRREGIPVQGKRLRVEALRMENGCYLLVTAMPKHVYRLRRGGVLCYRLETAGMLLDCTEALGRLGLCCGKNSVHELDGAYYLLFGYPALPKAARIVLSEFEAKRCPSLTAARVREHGRVLLEGNAILRIHERAALNSCRRAIHGTANS